VEREKGVLEDEKEKEVDLDDLLILDSVGSADGKKSCLHSLCPNFIIRF